MKNLRRILLLTIAVTICTTSLFESGPFIRGVADSMGPGSKGAEVEEIQQRLKNWGYFKGDIDGNYEWDTFQAVKSFQKYYGLPANGIAGEATLISMGLTRTINGGTAYAQAEGISNVQLLARAINGEARGEPYEGQVAVGAVILNRTRDPRFPKTIAGVIYQPGAFTAVSDGQINVPIDPNSTVVKAAGDALNGWDPSNGCVYYWNPATATSAWIWSRQVMKVIGKHYFGK